MSFDEVCLKERGKVLTGKYRHYCMEWDLLPIDETCPEWPCGCGIKEAVDAQPEQAVGQPS
jgi:hypothetical protein